MTTRQTITAHIRDVVFMCSSGFSIGFWQASPARWIFLKCLFIMSIRKNKRLFWNYRTTMKLRSAKCFSAWRTQCWNYKMYTRTIFNTVFSSIFVKYNFHGFRFWIDPRNEMSLKSELQFLIKYVLLKLSAKSPLNCDPLNCDFNFSYTKMNAHQN